ncbi:hypothetical protein H0H87_002516 [Tephrocybe sp. NHM501043]|nr:hypothetical protein H0H87_002516 [Tephrocybe sp. NHM501043]
MPSAPSSGSFVHAYGFLENALRNLNTPYTLPPAAQIYLDRAHQLWSRHHYNQRLLASHNCLSPALQGAAMGSLIFPSFPQASAGKMSQTIQLLTSHRSLALLLGSYTLKDWKLMVTLIYEAAGDLGLTSVLHDVFSPFFPAISNELSTILTAIPRDSLALESTPVWQSRLTCTPSPQGGSKAALRRRRRKKGTREQQVSDSQAGKRTATTAGHSALTKAAYSQHNNSTETSPSYKALTRTDFSAEASLSSTAASAIVPPSLQRFTFTVPRRGMTPSQLKSGRKSSSSSSYSTYLQNPSSHAYPPMMKAALTPSPLPPSVPDRSSSSSSYKLEPLSLRLQDLEMMFTRPMVPLRSAGQKNVKASASSMESSNAAVAADGWE